MTIEDGSDDDDLKDDDSDVVEVLTAELAWEENGG